MTANLTAAVAFMRTACLAWSVGYDQGNRWDVRDGGETDCSALVITALKRSGFDVGGATYTGNMLSNLTARGWRVVARYPQSATGLRAGDILLNDTNHTVMYIGAGLIAQASIDERGRIAGGQAGDQSGYETNVRPFYVYAHGGWPHVLRYVGAVQTVAASTGIPASSFNPNGYDKAYVKDVQTRLKAVGYSVGSSGVDSILGEDTFNAVKAFQKGKGLVVDGIPGPETLSALRAAVAAKAAPAKAAPAKAAPAKAAPAKTKAPRVTVQRSLGKVVVDGWWGTDTTRLAQSVLGTRPDGIVSSQDAGRKKILAACTSGWQFVPAGEAEGSQLIKAMQKRMGIMADGIVGPQFVNALEKRYGFKPDGHLDGPSNTVKAMQTMLNSGKF